MIDLRQSHSEFVAAIFDPHSGPPSDVTSHTGRHPLRRFNVYRNNVLSSLSDVLEAYFPVVTRLVGEEFFRAMARAYIRANPPASPILSQYGNDFPCFINQFGPVSDLPYLGDVARLEWLRLRAYHACDRKPIAARDLKQIPAYSTANTVFELHPSSSIIASPFPIVSIWKTNTLDDDVRTIDINVGGEAALVMRPSLQVLVIPLTDGIQAFLRAVRASVCLGKAAQYALARDGSFNVQIALAGLIEVGAFTSVVVRSPECRSQTEDADRVRIGRRFH